MRWRILHGVAWQGTTTVLARTARSLAWLVLGRLLSPSEFGSFAAIYVVMDGLYLLQELGLPQALVVRRTRVDESANSTFVLAALLGCAFAGLGWLLAPAVAAFYSDPALTLPFRVLSLVLVVHSLRVVPLRLFERDLDFRRKLAPTGWGAVAYVAIAIGGGTTGWGLWSLVAAVLGAAVVETVGFWMISPWRPQWRFRRDVVREDVLFGLPVVAAAILAYAYSSLDRLALGRFTTPETLGAYAFAFTLAMAPSVVGSTVVNAVLLPSYSGLGDDRTRRRELHLHALALAGGLNLLFVALVFAAGGPFLRAAYGSKWDAAAGPMIVLAGAGFLRGVASLTGELLVGTGRPGAYRTMNLLQLGVAAVALGPGLLWRGAEGVAFAMAIAAAVAVLRGWSSARAPLEASFRDFPAALGPPGVASAATWAVALLIIRLLPAALGIWSILAAAVGGTGVFFVLWWRLDARLRRVLQPGPGGWRPGEPAT